MLSSVLRSKRAIQMNIVIMRAFVRLREMIASNKGLARRLNELEKKYDGQFRVVFDAIRQLRARLRRNPAGSDSRPERSLSGLVSLVRLVCLVYFVHLVCLIVRAGNLTKQTSSYVP